MTPQTFYEVIQARLVEVVNPQTVVTIGDVPDDTPYVIIWPAPGTAVNEPLVDGRMGSEATDLTFQITTAAPDPLYLLNITNRVTNALTDYRINHRLVRPDPIANRAAQPLRDDTVRPVRHYMATTWQTQLTRSTNAERSEKSVGHRHPQPQQ